MSSQSNSSSNNRNNLGQNLTLNSRNHNNIINIHHAGFNQFYLINANGTNILNTISQNNGGAPANRINILNNNANNPNLIINSFINNNPNIPGQNYNNSKLFFI